MIPGLLRLAKDKQTYTNIYYLLLAFPLGLFYFIFLIVGLTLGIGTLIIWIGIPILLLVLMLWWKLAAFERAMTMRWLKVQIPPMMLPAEGKKTRLERVRAHLSHSVTWKSLVYLLTKFIFGTVAFVITLYALTLVIGLSAVTLVVGLLIAPFCYLFVLLTRRTVQVTMVRKTLLLPLMGVCGIAVALAFYYLFIRPVVSAPAGVLPYNLAILIPMALAAIVLILLFCVAPPVYIRLIRNDAATRAATMKQILRLSLTGCGLIFVPLYVTSGMAWLWGRFAYAMLGMSDKAIRLAEAEALARQERARAELAEQKRRELIVNVSHELRTPVASIRGHLEALLNTYDETRLPTPETQRQYLAIVHREAVRLGALVDDLLSLAHTEASELRLDMKAVAVDEVVEEVYQTLMPLARRERQITLVRSIAPGLPMAIADRQRLVQVLLNLVRNAITYTPDGGIVSMMLERRGRDYLALSVADTGIGIPPEDLERVFERFYRTDASRSRTSGGFGLGLAIVRDLVTAMGGSVSVESKVGEGSCFRVLLRIA